jgi:hypothetical protein
VKCITAFSHSPPPAPLCLEYLAENIVNFRPYTYDSNHLESFSFPNENFAFQNSIATLLGYVYATQMSLSKASTVASLDSNPIINIFSYISI